MFESGRAVELNLGSGRSLMCRVYEVRSEAVAILKYEPRRRGAYAQFFVAQAAESGAVRVPGTGMYHAVASARLALVEAAEAPSASAALAAAAFAPASAAYS